MRTLKTQLVEALRKYMDTKRQPRVPEAGVLLWNIFMKLSATRTYHMAGATPISYTEIHSFSVLTGWPLQPHHVDIIRALDEAWLEHSYSEMTNKSNGMHMTSGDLTPDAFDAIFG